MKEIQLYGKKYASIRSAIRQLNPVVSEGTIRNRLDRGWSPEKAFSEPIDTNTSLKQKVYENGGSEKDYWRILKRINSGMAEETALHYPFRGGEKKGQQCIVYGEEFFSLTAAFKKFTPKASEGTIRRWADERGYSYPKDLSPLFEEIPKPGLGNGSIYMITFQGPKPNIYIGQTISTVKKRFQKHWQDALSGKSKSKLHLAMRRHGIEKFECKIIEDSIPNIGGEYAKNDPLSELERYYIEKFDTFYPNGFNIQKPTRGGGSISHSISLPGKTGHKSFPSHKKACEWLADDQSISYEAAKGRLRKFKKTQDPEILYRDAPNAPGSGVANTKEYKAWSAFKSEKCNPNSKNYAGVKIDKEMSKFNCFLERVGSKPGQNYLLQLIEPDVGFVVGNVEWRLRGTLPHHHPDCLRIRYPELAATWAPNNTKEITPDNISCRSNRIVYWTLYNEGTLHYFAQRVVDRVRDYVKTCEQDEELREDNA